FPVAGKVASVSFGKPRNPQRRIQPQQPSILVRERRRYHHTAVVMHRDEAQVERGVEVGSEKEPVEDVEPLRVGRTVGPRLDVAGPQERPDGKTRDRAAPFPVLDEARTKDVLADALNNEPLDLRGPRKRGDLLL